MLSNIKRSLFTLLLSFGLLTVAYAQDKFEYAIVKFVPQEYSNDGLSISISGKEFTKIDTPKVPAKYSKSDYTPLLNHVQSMTDNGWRVINTFTQSFADISFVHFVLERKKQ